MRVYVASSWRNPHQPSVVAALRAAGHDVYDFRHPEPGNDGFSWAQIDPQDDGGLAARAWSAERLRRALEHPLATEGFRLDSRAVLLCDACVLVLPCGRSAHLEAGFARGRGALLFVLMLDPDEPELMYAWADRICGSVDELRACLAPGLDGSAKAKAVPNDHRTRRGVRRRVVSDRKIVEPGELPPTWGLLAPRGEHLAAVVEAPKLTPVELGRPFLAAVCRAAQAQAMAPAEAEIAKAKAKGFEEGRAAGKRDAELNGSSIARALEELGAEAATKVRSLARAGSDLPRLIDLVAHYRDPSSIEEQLRVLGEAATRIAAVVDRELGARTEIP